MWNYLTFLVDIAYTLVLIFCVSLGVHSCFGDGSSGFGGIACSHGVYICGLHIGVCRCGLRSCYSLDEKLKTAAYSSSEDFVTMLSVNVTKAHVHLAL